MNPKPWKVAYWVRCPEWHPQSSPYIVDADGGLVVNMPQHVGHPGIFDEKAVIAAHEIVNAVNSQYGAFGL